MLAIAELGQVRLKCRQFTTATITNHYKS